MLSGGAVGFSLGLIGGGGSILAVPFLLSPCICSCALEFLFGSQFDEIAREAPTTEVGDI